MFIWLYTCLVGTEGTVPCILANLEQRRAIRPNYQNSIV